MNDLRAFVGLALYGLILVVVLQWALPDVMVRTFIGIPLAWLGGAIIVPWAYER
jgi:hypothetical protein